jgi:quercetin dioxygenase-like cupin family protein
MRLVITGVDEHGRSCVRSDRELDFVSRDPGSGFSFAELFATATAPPPARTAGSAAFVDLGLGPGLISWSAVAYGPGAATHSHHSDSIDLEIVLSGSIELELDDGVHLLEEGSCIVMSGVDHLWRAGPDGCVLSVLSVGTPPPVPR